MDIEEQAWELHWLVGELQSEVNALAGTHHPQAHRTVILNLSDALIR